MTLIIAQGKFWTGRIVITSGAQSELSQDEVLEGLARHVAGDWGDVDEDDRKENEFSLEHGFRLLSSYATPRGTKFWIITEHDRSVTTILLPEEY
ncbi:MAG: hypothetical protein NTY19_36635 [Planctomycetota bacterium]|nr:hypothetical protein [Planctomycetota bacterium]